MSDSKVRAAMDLSKLKALARNATPGPWRARFDGHGGMCLESLEWQIGYLSRAGGKQEGNAAFITAAGPDAVLALIEVAEKAQAVMSPAGYSANEWDALRSALSRLGGQG